MQNAGAPGSAAFGHQLPGDHVRVPEVQEELWKAVNFLMSLNCLDCHTARFLCHYVFVLFVTSETHFIFIPVPYTQKQCEKFHCCSFIGGNL